METQEGERYCIPGCRFSLFCRVLSSVQENRVRGNASQAGFQPPSGIPAPPPSPPFSIQLSLSLSHTCDCLSAISPWKPMPLSSLSFP